MDSAGEGFREWSERDARVTGKRKSVTAVKRFPAAGMQKRGSLNRIARLCTGVNIERDMGDHASRKIQPCPEPRTPSQEQAFRKGFSHGEGGTVLQGSVPREIRDTDRGKGAGSRSPPAPFPVMNHAYLPGASFFPDGMIQRRFAERKRDQKCTANLVRSGRADWS